MLYLLYFILSVVTFRLLYFFFFFFFNDTATTEIYTLSLHDALPTSRPASPARTWPACAARPSTCPRSEEHTSELQSQSNLVCRLLLEKKKKKTKPNKNQSNNSEKPQLQNQQTHNTYAKQRRQNTHKQ